jgi:hypothetical protein
MRDATIRRMNGLPPDHEDQLDREVAEALRYLAMTPEQKSQWLEEHWMPLQRRADAIMAMIPATPGPLVRHFATMEEKNRFDEERDAEFAALYTQLVARPSKGS